MQDIMPPVGAGAQLIQSYGSTGFRIGNVQYESHVLVTPTSTVAWNGELTLDALMPLFETVPPTEVALIGMGKRNAMLDPALRAAFKERGVGVDSMDTGAACRTFNILLGEGRHVVAVLLLSA